MGKDPPRGRGGGDGGGGSKGKTLRCMHAGYLLR